MISSYILKDETLGTGTHSYVFPVPNRYAGSTCRIDVKRESGTGTLSTTVISATQDTDGVGQLNATVSEAVGGDGVIADVPLYPYLFIDVVVSTAAANVTLAVTAEEQ